MSVLLVLFGLYSAHLNSRLSGGGWTVPGSEEARAERAQDAGFIGRGSSSVALLVHDDKFSAPSAEFEDRVAGVIQQVTTDPRLQIRSQPDRRSLTGPKKDEFLGRDARTTLTTLELGIDDGTAKRVLPEVERGLSVFNTEGLRVHLVGQAASVGAINEVGAAALSRIEMILLPLVVAILLILYRSVAAALLSLVVSVTAIVIAMGVLTWVAVIDELTRLDRAAALANTMRTAGRTVAASGATVAAALSTMLIVDLPLIRSMAVAAIVVVVVAVITCLIVLPAVLYLLGPRAAAWRVPWLPSTRERARRRWGRVARTIMARPVAALAITSVALLTLAVPALGLQTGSADASALPRSSSVREGNDLVDEQYGKNAVDPILVVIEADQPFSGPEDFARLAAMTTTFGQLDHVVRVASPVPILHTVMPADPFAAIEPTNFRLLPADSRTLINRFVSADRKTIAVDIFSNEGAGDSNVATLLGEVRAVAKRTAAAGWQVSVGGTAAVVLSATQHISDASPIVIATMLVIIYLLLVLTLRSLLLPCKAIALNLLSVGASVGAVVLIFQHGFLAGLLGIESVGPVQNFVPILLVTVLFSLSTDYEVFLLSRVRERYELTGDNTESVTYGLVETAP